MMTSMLSKLLLSLIKGYRFFISPIIPARCRYYPTCSDYGLTAIRWHGPQKGGWLTVKRISRCHPLGGHGIDFVPLPLYQYTYKPVSKILGNQPYVSRGTLLIERGIYVDTSSYMPHLSKRLKR